MKVKKIYGTIQKVKIINSVVKKDFLLRGNIIKEKSLPTALIDKVDYIEES